MPGKQEVIRTVKAAFEHEPRINLHHYPVQIDFENGVLTLEGEVEHIAAKKLAMELGIAVSGVTGIIDRLHITPAVTMGDGAILDSVRNSLIQESGLQNCVIRVRKKGRVETIRESTIANPGVIELSVTDGVVLLDDHVSSLAQKRLAGVLAWWVPGSRDVINGMAVSPPEADSDEEISDAVRLVLEKNPLVNSDQVRITTQKSIVTLEGQVLNERQKHIAEFDAWYVFGVDKVLNQLEVRE